MSELDKDIVRTDTRKWLERLLKANEELNKAHEEISKIYTEIKEVHDAVA